MWRTQIREKESKIEAEKRIKYKGTARIRLKWLHFPWNQPRELDSKNVKRLIEDFRKDCRRLDEHNHIPAVIDQQSLDAAEERSGVSTRQLGKYPQGGYPELVFPAGYQVECLHGRHRIQAAKELGLDWWTVDLYLADVDPNLRTCLAEEYSNAKKPNDGEIYRKIRQYHFQQNLRFEWRWWSRLSLHGKRCLKQLLRHEELTAALDALRGIPGLWGGIRLHTWNTILAIRCDDVILRYLYHIGNVWGKLLQHDTSVMQHVDEVTVKALELRAPRVCTRDADEVQGQILGGTIFSAFGEEDRAGIWARVQAVDDLIPCSIWRHLPSDSLFPRMYIYISAGLFVSTSVVQCVGVLWRNGNFRHGRARALVTHAEGSVKIKITLSRALKVEAGQHINLWIPSVSFSSFLQSHPFVVTSWSHEEQNQLELFVEPRRGLTRELLYRAQAGERGGAFGSCWVLFSGPHGISAPVGEIREHSLGRHWVWDGCAPGLCAVTIE